MVSRPTPHTLFIWTSVFTWEESYGRSNRKAWHGHRMRHAPQQKFHFSSPSTLTEACWGRWKTFGKWRIENHLFNSFAKQVGCCLCWSEPVGRKHFFWSILVEHICSRESLFIKNHQRRASKNSPPGSNLNELSPKIILNFICTFYFLYIWYAELRIQNISFIIGI